MCLFYTCLHVPHTEMPILHVPHTDAPLTLLPRAVVFAHVPLSHVPHADVSHADVPHADVPHAGVPHADMPRVHARYTLLPIQVAQHKAQCARGAHAPRPGDGNTRRGTRRNRTLLLHATPRGMLGGGIRVDCKVSDPFLYNVTTR